MLAEGSKNRTFEFGKREKPQETHKASRNGEKMTVCYALLVNGAIGLYYFDDQIVEGESYFRLLFQYSLPVRRNLSKNAVL